MIRCCPRPRTNKYYLSVPWDVDHFTGDYRPNNIEKCKNSEFEHLISVYNGKRGLHLVVLYLVVGRWRIPWFPVWRGRYSLTRTARAKTSQTQSLKSNFQVMILADTAFGTVELLHGIRKKYHAVTGVPLTVNC